MSSPVTFLTDFSDRISPMLVKELRQGMRAKTFIAVFLSLQIFLAVMLFSAGAASTSDQVGGTISAIIFTFFSIAVVIVQPLRGTSALSSEVKGNTIDMMVLTRLSAWRIVFGKWVAIVGQSALLFSTIIPYLILRYFFGGMNLFAEMVLLILLFLTSMALTAVTVGLSGCSSVIVRMLIPVLGLPFMLYILLVMSFSSRYFGGSSFMDVFALDNTDARIGVAAYVVAIVYVAASMLSLGASLIAPAAENHAVHRRLVAITAMLVLLAVSVFDLIDDEYIILLLAVIAVPAIVISLTDSAPLVSTVCKPFVKRGILGRAAGWLLYPSWPSGILFAILIGFIGLSTILGLAFSSTYWDQDETIVILSLTGGLFFPAVWQVFLFRGEGQRVAHYLLLLVGSLVMLGVLAILSDAMNSGTFLWFFAWNPLAFIPLLESNHSNDELTLAGVIVVDVILWLILLGRAVIDIKASAQIIQEARSSPAPSD